jgi:carboxymethylenebutenolidase
MMNRTFFRTAFVFLLVTGIAGVALAQGVLPPVEAQAKERLASSPRHGEWVSVPAGGGDKVEAWVVYPERKDRAPVVLVVHEIFGLSDWVRSVADQLAAEGFIAVAPDLLSGKGPGGKGSEAVDSDQAGRLIMALEPQEIVRRLDAVARYATKLPAATGRFGVVGFCWGGGISFLYATAQPDLSAAVVFYGVSPATSALARIKAPVLGLYGGDDARVGATVPAAQADMKRLGKRYEVESYAGAGHAFMRQQDAREGANLRAAQQAWPRALQFLRQALEAQVSLAGPQAQPASYAAEQVTCTCGDEPAAATEVAQAHD